MIPLGVMAGAHVPAASGGDYDAEVLADSPWAYLPLTGPTPSWYGATFTPTGGGPTYGAGVDLGNGGPSAVFPNNPWVGLSGPSAGTVTAWTIEVLVRPAAAQARHILASMEQADIPADDRFMFLLQDMRPRLYSGHPSWASFFEATGATLSAGTTYHLAATIHPALAGWADASIYVDGTLAATGSIALSATQPMTPFLGRRVNTIAANSMNGAIAGAAFHHQALPSARILAHAQAAGVA